MSDEEVRKFVADIFNNSESIKQWREAAELARGERQRQADLLREAVRATARTSSAQDSLGLERLKAAVRFEDEAWKAYKESL